MRAWWIGMAVAIGLLVVTGGAAPARADGRPGGDGPRAPSAGATRYVYLQNLARQASPTVNPAVSGVQIQNLDPIEPARTQATFATEAGALTTLTQPLFPPLSAYNLYLPAEARLTEGWHAAAVEGDRRLAAISRTEWLSTGGAAMLSNSMPGTDLVVPLLVHKYAGQSSVVRIQNTLPDQPADVVLRLNASGMGEVRVLRRTIPPAGFVTLDLANHPDFLGLPIPFTGWLRVQSDIPVAASSYVAYENGSRAVYGFEGVPLESASTRLYAPLVRNAYYGTTGISVVNPGAIDAQVTVRFVGSLTRDNYAGCVGRTFTQGPVPVPAGSNAVFYQANVAVPGTGTSPLPADCAGAATIEAADGAKVLAVVNDATGDSARPASAAAYNAVSAAQAAQRVALPLYRNRHTKAQLTTGIQAMNVGDVAARVEITFALNDAALISGAACGGACLQWIGPGGSYTWFPAAIPALPANKYGSALIASDQPLAVIVNDASLTGALDAAIYNGIKADEVEPATP